MGTISKLNEKMALLKLKIENCEYANETYARNAIARSSLLPNQKSTLQRLIKECYAPEPVRSARVAPMKATPKLRKKPLSEAKARAKLGELAAVTDYKQNAPTYQDFGAPESINRASQELNRLETQLIDQLDILKRNQDAIARTELEIKAAKLLLLITTEPSRVAEVVTELERRAAEAQKLESERIERELLVKFPEHNELLASQGHKAAE